MANKKAVFLFGAGAVLDWGAPRTICDREKLTCIPEHGSDEIKNRVCCLTHLMTDTGFHGKDGECITNKIFKVLSSKNNTYNSINFETIINVLEDLYAYWATQKNKESSNLYSLVDLKDQLEDFHYFEHSEPDKCTKRYSISIPGLQFDRLKDELHPIQKYYEMFLNELLSGIKGHVSKYSYHTSGKSVVFQPCNEPVNKHFCNWMQKFVADDYSLRMYTLNYDRMFKVLLQSNQLNVFEGFELDGAAVDYKQRIPPNLRRIISDFDSHIHYNLHGSAYWNIEESNSNNLLGYQYYLVPFGKINSPVTTIEMEKGRQLLLTTIITGYQKVQRTAIAPFRQMLSAFDRDCFEADKLYIIGYSLGDEHINDIIRNSRKYNTQLEIVLINPNFDKKRFVFDFLSHWGRTSDFYYKNEGEDRIVSPDFNVKM